MSDSTPAIEQARKELLRVVHLYGVQPNPVTLLAIKQELDALLAAAAHGRGQGEKRIEPQALRAQVQIVLSRLSAIREAARKPARDFNLDYQLGMLHDNIETSFNIPEGRPWTPLSEDTQNGR